MATAPRHRGLQSLHDEFIGGDPEKLALLETAKTNAEVARSIYRMRKAAGLTQVRLAALIGTTASVVSRLEDADYEGHSLTMLRRVARALGAGVEVRFVFSAGARRPAKPAAKTAKVSKMPKAAKPKAPRPAAKPARPSAVPPRPPTGSRPKKIRIKPG